MAEFYLSQPEFLVPPYSFPDKPYCAASAFCTILNYHLRKLGQLGELDPESVFLKAYPDWSETILGPSEQIIRYAELWNEGALSSALGVEKSCYCLVEKEKLATLDSLARMKSSLGAFGPIIVEVPLYLSSFAFPFSGIFQPISSDEKPGYLGMHLMVVDGYDDKWTSGQCLPEEGAVFVRNCWGLSWGYKGRGVLPYSYFLDERPSYFYVFKWGSR